MKPAGDSAGFPQTHSTTTGTGTAVAYAVTGRPYLDIGQITTVPAIFKIVEAVVSFITFIICVATSDIDGLANWSGFVSFFGIVGPLVLLALILLHIMDLLPRIPWPLVELVYYGLWTLLFVIAVICMIILSTHTYSDTGSAVAGAIFCFICTLIFGADGLLTFQKFRGRSLMPTPPPQEPAPYTGPVAP